MIEQERVIQLVKEKLDDSMFIVDISVNEHNVIQVYIDSFEGLTIDQCIAVSRHVEHSFDRETEDFELQVSSPGLTENFKVAEQYIKYIGRAITVKTRENGKLEGTILDADREKIVLETSTREKLEGSKKKQLIVKQHQLTYDEITSAKPVISFK